MANPEYHVRPYPQQPKKGGAKLIHYLEDLEKAISTFPANKKNLKDIQAKIHSASQNINDDKLVDFLRQLSMNLDTYIETLNENLPQEIFSLILKVRIELKRI